jgi:hypothetical protein
MRRNVLVPAAAVVFGLLIATGQGAGDEPKIKGSESVVKVTARADKPGADGKQVVTVTLAVDKDWDLYANPVGPKDYEKAQTTVTVEGKKADEVQIDYPKGEVITDPLGEKLAVYRGEVAIKAAVRRASGDPPLKLKVAFMASSDKKGVCLIPSTVELTVP